MAGSRCAVPNSAGIPLPCGRFVANMYPGSPDDIALFEKDEKVLVESKGTYSVSYDAIVAQPSNVFAEIRKKTFAEGGLAAQLLKCTNTYLDKKLGTVQSCKFRFLFREEDREIRRNRAKDWFAKNA